MTELVWHAGWTAAFAWITYSTAEAVLSGRRTLSLKGRTKKFHDYFMQPFGAVLTFVFGCVTLLAAWGLVQLILRGN